MTEYNCKLCGEKSIEEDVDLDEAGKGFWCNMCDGYTSFKSEDRNRYTLYLEDIKEGVKLPSGNKLLSKRISPLRYPGGKSLMIDFVAQEVEGLNVETFVEPFCGGASVGLALLQARRIKKLILNDLDKGVYSLYFSILNNHEELIDLINTTDITKQLFYEYKKEVLCDYANEESIIRRGFMFLVVNRCAFSGIPMSNCCSDLTQRYKPETLIQRIMLINKMGKDITVTSRDALEVIEENYWPCHTMNFIDPPYVNKGSAL